MGSVLYDTALHFLWSMWPLLTKSMRLAGLDSRLVVTERFQGCWHVKIGFELRFFDDALSRLLDFFFHQLHQTVFNQLAVEGISFGVEANLCGSCRFDRLSKFVATCYQCPQPLLLEKAQKCLSYTSVGWIWTNWNNSERGDTKGNMHCWFAQQWEARFRCVEFNNCCRFINAARNYPANVTEDFRDKYYG